MLSLKLEIQRDVAQFIKISFIVYIIYHYFVNFFNY